MLKKIGLWVLVAGFSGLLIWGAVNRTSARDNDAQETGISGQGNGRQTQDTAAQEPARQGETGSQWGRNSSAAASDTLAEDGRTTGLGQGQADKEGSDQPTAAALLEADHPEDWDQLLGQVINVNQDALELTLSDLETIIIEGQSWRYAQELGFSAQVGDDVVVVGFLEDGEFKVGMLENMTSNQVVVLREPSGRPIWAGGSRRRSEI